MQIELIVSVVSFQRRFCWELSSLLQQCGSVPDLSINVAYIPNEGNPTTERVCAYFKSLGLHIIENPLPRETMQFRGKVRNIQLTQSKSDWGCFIDADMCYDPYFFSDLAQQLSGQLKNETRCISASRVSLAKDFSKNFFNTCDGATLPYPCLISEPTEILKTWPLFKAQTANKGAGYFQLANIENLRKNHQGHYWQPNNRRDSEWGYRSDRQFRNMLGGICPITTKPQYHLNHERDNEEGKHVENQR